MLSRLPRARCFGNQPCNRSHEFALQRGCRYSYVCSHIPRWKTIQLCWDSEADVASNAITDDVNFGHAAILSFLQPKTYAPITHIAKIVTNKEDDAEIVRVLGHWRIRKIYEMKFIQVASAILAGGVIGCLQWTSLSDAFWLGPALWYCSLVLSILSMLLSSSQALIFDSLNDPTEDEGSPGDYRRYLSIILKCRTKVLEDRGEEGSGSRKFKEWVPRWRMVFTWQCPMMFMAYAVCFFLIGLTLFICTALINGEKSTGAAKTAYFYLVVTALTVGIFVYCSFWGYKYVDFDKN